jgi:TetR/AcrR family transcriptional regulator, transcriptional repressor for nem operon
MARSSRADAARHHEELIRAASRLFRERGVGAVSVPDVMGEIGLTRGGFYKHFESKEALVAAAVDATFAEHVGRIQTMAEDNAHDPGRTRAAFVDFCLSSDNRDDPAHGCPASLATAMGYTEHEGTPREAFVAGTRAVLDELTDTATDDDPDPGATRRRNLADLSTVVGAILLSRATAGDPISDEILAAAHLAVGGTDRPDEG